MNLPTGDNISFFFPEDKEDKEDKEGEYKDKEASVSEYVQHFFDDDELVDIVDGGLYTLFEQDENIISVVHDYETSYTVKDLLKIAEYYEITKQVHKSKKIEVIYAIVLFENAGENVETVLRRKQLWRCIEHLKQDKFMKRFVVW